MRCRRREAVVAAAPRVHRVNRHPGSIGDLAHAHQVDHHRTLSAASCTKSCAQLECTKPRAPPRTGARVSQRRMARSSPRSPGAGRPSRRGPGWPLAHAPILKRAVVVDLRTRRPFIARAVRQAPRLAGTRRLLRSGLGLMSRARRDPRMLADSQAAPFSRGQAQTSSNEPDACISNAASTPGSRRTRSACTRFGRFAATAL